MQRNDESNQPLQVSNLVDFSPVLLQLMSQFLGLRDYPAVQLVCKTTRSYMDNSKLLLQWHFPDVYQEIQAQVEKSREYKDEDEAQARFFGRLDVVKVDGYKKLLKQAYQTEYAGMAPDNIKYFTFFKEGDLEHVLEFEEEIIYLRINDIRDHRGLCLDAWAYRNGHAALSNYFYQQAIQDFKTDRNQIDFHKRDNRGVTVLHHAVFFWQDIKVIGSLVEAGADVNARTEENCSPAMFAAADGYLEAVQYFIFSGKVSVHDIPNAIVKSATHAGQLDVVRYLFQDVIKEMSTEQVQDLILIAVTADRVPMIRFYYEEVLKRENVNIIIAMAYHAASNEKLAALRYFYERPNMLNDHLHLTYLFQLATQFNCCSVVQYLCEHSSISFVDYFEDLLELIMRERDRVDADMLQYVCCRIRQYAFNMDDRLWVMEVLDNVLRTAENHYREAIPELSVTILSVSQYFRLKSTTDQLYERNHRYYQHLIRALNQRLSRYHKKFPETISLEELRWIRCGDELTDSNEEKMSQDKVLLKIIEKLEAVTRLQEKIDPKKNPPSIENIRLFGRLLERENQNINDHRVDYFWQRFILDVVTICSVVGLVIRPIYSYYQSGSFRFWKSEGAKASEKLRENIRSIESLETVSSWAVLCNC